MGLRDQISNRIATAIRNVIRRTRTHIYRTFPGVPRFLERYLPQLKSRLGQATRMEYKTSEERRTHIEIITLLTKYSYQQIVDLMSREGSSGVLSYLRNWGFIETKDSIDFKLVPCELKVDQKSLVEIQRVNGGNLEIKIDFFHVKNPEILSRRLVNFLIGYRNGIEKILDHEYSEHGRKSFYLGLEDSYEMDSKEEFNSSFYAFSRLRESIHVGLVPDPYALADLNSKATFPDLGGIEEARANFLSRKKKIFWRGSTTGHFQGRRITKNQRIAYCVLSSEYPDFFDLGITSVVQQFNTKHGRKKLIQSGVMGDSIPESDFADYMAYLDLEGNASAWGTFRKYLQHVHIMKPAPEFSHFFDFFQIEGSHTQFIDFDDLLVRLQRGEIIIDDFDVAHRGYLSAINALALMASGDATVFPVRS